MRKIFLTFIWLIVFSSVVNAADNSDKDFATEGTRLVCALSSLAAYSDDEGFLARSILDAHGWKIESIVSEKNNARVKAYLIGRKFPDEPNIKILVVAGTEDIQDVEVNFRMGGVELHKDVDDEIFVHKGFRDYADSTLAGGVAEYIIDELNKNPDETLYLTGHSLGGTVALMTAIRLADMGVDKNRMKVITFGALALGNKKLADAYEDKIDFTRIEVKGDVVRKIFEPFGYVQFGENVKYKPAKDVDHYEHKMTLYLDCAIRNYFDAGGFDFPVSNSQNKIDAPIYVAPIKFVEESFNSKDKKYIYGLIRMNLSARFSNVIFDEQNYYEVENADDVSNGVTRMIQTAKDAGCRYVFVQLISGERVRDAQDDERKVSVYEFLYDVEGTPIFMQTSGMSTKDFTLIEAAAFAHETLRKKFETSLQS